MIHNATLPDGRTQMSVAVQGGRITEVTQGLQAPARETVDAQGLLLSPPFVDAHFHLDTTLTYGMPRVNQSGTLLEGIALWGELKPQLTQDLLIAKALTYCDWAVANGLLAIRSHVDTCDPRLLAVEALLEVKKQVAPCLDLQLVAFPQDGALRDLRALALLQRALAMGVDVVGGIPHFERTSEQGAHSVKLLCELAAAQGKLVDMHCDESDDPHSRHIETLAFEAQRLGLQGRVESYPKRRGMARVPELLAHGVTVAFGHDDVQDPFYPLGSAAMLEVASMGLHVAQMTSQSAMRQCFAAITTSPAQVMHLQDYGIAPGCHADLVLLQARNPVEAIRLRATRLKVWRRGQCVAHTPAATATLQLPGRPGVTSWMI